MTLDPCPTGADPVTIPIVVTAGSASSSDYSVSAQAVDVGSKSGGTITITIVDDRIDEDNEYLTVRFGNNLPQGVTQGNVPVASVTITDDDTKGVAVLEGVADSENPITALTIARRRERHLQGRFGLRNPPGT